MLTCLVNNLKQYEICITYFEGHNLFMENDMVVECMALKHSKRVNGDFTPDGLGSIILHSKVSNVKE